MANYDAFKKKAGETASYVADKGVVLAKCAADKTRVLGKMAAARADLAMERENLRKSRIELGKAYYKKFGQDAEDDMAATCAQVKEALEKIEARKTELRALRAQLKENPFASDAEE